jgi:hypothetical protein
MKIALSIIGVLLVLMGVVWFLQGINVLQGSAVMSGQSQWAWYGGLVALIGIGLLVFSNRRGAPKKDS